MTPRRTWTTLVLMALVSAARPAPCDDLTALLQEGLALREAGHEAEALEVFRRAWALTRSPRAQAQIGMVEHALGRWRDAEEHLVSALAATGDPWIAQHRVTLRRVLGVIGGHIGSLEVTGTAGATVWIDGVPAGVLPLQGAVRLDEGFVRLEVRAPGHEPSVRQVRIVGGSVVREALHLDPLRAPSLALRALPVSSARSPLPAGGRDLRGANHATLGALLVAGAAAALATSAVSYFVYEGAARDYNAGFYAGRCRGTDAAVEVEPECQRQRDLADTTWVLSLTGVVAASALGTAAAVVYLTRPGAPSTRTARITCGVGPGEVGLACGGAF